MKQKKPAVQVKSFDQTFSKVWPVKHRQGRRRHRLMVDLGSCIFIEKIIKYAFKNTIKNIPDEM